MAQATVKTVQYLDPRIEPQPDPVYDYVIGPTQNQYYKLPASGFSQSSITFNNLTTLGIDRAYLDTFEIELTADVVFELQDNAPDDPQGFAVPFAPLMCEWTFQSFPFNTCCEEARVNINGGAFFSQPMMYIRAKERYMNQYELSKSYQNICPCHRPESQFESGSFYWRPVDMNERFANLSPIYRGKDCRYGAGHGGYMKSTEGIIGGDNMSFINLNTNGAPDYTHAGYLRRADNDQAFGGAGKRVVMTNLLWREPLFVSPFSSRYDATYGRPLYNITSMDLSFNLCSDLGNMIRVMNLNAPCSRANNTNPDFSMHSIKGIKVILRTASLCYQVMTIPPILNKPLTTLVPYRRFVPYITEYNQQSPNSTNTTATQVSLTGQIIKMSSGVYTFNEIPTAIWVFVAPVKDRYQTNAEDYYLSPRETGALDNNSCNANGNWDSNKLFAYLRSVNISMANTTQILATAKPPDLYRIAKANGCEDSAESWMNSYPVNRSIPYKWIDALNTTIFSKDDVLALQDSATYYNPPYNTIFTAGGAGSVLRLKPGVDIIVPDQPLIPGANANNMVFQVEVEAQTPPTSVAQTRYALWLLFEYVGVAAISPGQCEITMNPLGSGEIMAVSPVMSATSEATEGNLEGSGFWDNAKKKTKILGQLADDGIISMILKRIPGAQGAVDWAKKHGLGEPACKRGRGGAVTGGAVIGKGLNDWV